MVCGLSSCCDLLTLNQYPPPSSSQLAHSALHLAISQQLEFLTPSLPFVHPKHQRSPALLPPPSPCPSSSPTLVFPSPSPETSPPPPLKRPHPHSSLTPPPLPILPLPGLPPPLALPLSQFLSPVPLRNHCSRRSPRLASSHPSASFSLPPCPAHQPTKIPTAVPCLQFLRWVTSSVQQTTLPLRSSTTTWSRASRLWRRRRLASMPRTCGASAACWCGWSLGGAPSQSARKRRLRLRRACWRWCTSSTTHG